MSTSTRIEGFLSKVGKALSTGLTIASDFLPVLAPFVGGGAPAQILQQAQTVATKGINDLTAIGSAVIQVETAMQGVSGAQKLQSAAALVKPILETSEFLMGTQTGDVAEFNAGVQDLVNAVVRIYNSRKPTINLKASGDPQPANAPATPVPTVPPVLAS